MNVISDSASKHVHNGNAHQVAWEDSERATSIIQEIVSPALQQCEDQSTKDSALLAIGMASTVFNGIAEQLRDLFFRESSTSGSFEGSLPKLPPSLDHVQKVFKANKTLAKIDRWQVKQGLLELRRISIALDTYFKKLPTIAEERAALKGCVTLRTSVHSLLPSPLVPTSSSSST